MLGFMRKHARSAFIKIIFWMIIIVFVFWGVGIMVGGGDRVNVAALVDGQPITAQAYARAYENMQRLYQQIYKDNFTSQVAAQLNLHQRALDDLVTDVLLRREAGRLGLQVTDDEVRDAILNVPAFRDGGRFDRERYLATLRASRITPTEFEEARREELLVGKLESLLTDGLSVSDRELHDLFLVEHEKINVAFVKVPYERFESAAEVTDAEVTEYYESNKESFRQPERVAVTWIPYAPEAFEAKVPVSDEAVQAYYDSRSSDFEAPEKVRVRHILFLIPADADEAARAKIRATAEAVLAEARGGGDFAALASKHSKDPLSAEAGGDLGLVERGKLEAPLEQAAFALESGQIGDLVESPRGLHVIKVDEKTPAGTRPLAEVREEIVRALQREGADQAVRDALAADAAQAREGRSLEEIATERGVKATAELPHAPGQPLVGVKNSAELLRTAIGLDAGTIQEFEGAEPPLYLFKVVEKLPSTIKPIDEARESILKTLRSQKAKQAARAEAEAMLAQVGAGNAIAGLDAAARAKGYALDETGPFTRTEGIPKLGLAPINARLFSLTSAAPLGDRVEVLSDAAVLVALKERLPPDEASFADKRDALRDSTLARKRSRVLESYRDALRQRADITVNPDVVTGVRG